MPRAAEVRLLDVDPDLGVLLDAARRGQAERELVVRAHRLPIGPWDVSGLARARAADVGLLIVSGVLASELVIADEVSMELLGTGDLVRPWQPVGRTALLPVGAVWTASPCSRYRSMSPSASSPSPAPIDEPATANSPRNPR